MSEYDAIDAMIERAAREEQDDIDRKQGQQILDMLDARNNQGVDPLFEILNRAHQAMAKADEE